MDAMEQNRLSGFVYDGKENMRPNVISHQYWLIQVDIVVSWMDGQSLVKCLI
jgi:hypothetical protein